MVGHRALRIVEGLPKPQAYEASRGSLAPTTKQTWLVCPSAFSSINSGCHSHTHPIWVWHPAALRFRRWVSWGWLRRVESCSFRAWGCGRSLVQETGHRRMTFWPWECGAFRARPRVCVWGDSRAYWPARIREWETMGYHLSPSHSSWLIPGPNTRPGCLQLNKKWEHGTMPHVRDVRKPKHSTALMRLIWFMKCNFCGILCPCFF